MLKKIIKKYSFILGFLILAVIISRVDFRKLAYIIKEANYFWILLGVLMIIPMYFIQSWRWNYLKKNQNIKFKLIDSFLIYNVGFLLGGITPARIGEIVKVYYLKSAQNSTGKSLVSVLVDRLMDIIYLLVFGYLGVIFALQGLKIKMDIIYAILILSLILLIILYKKGWGKLFLKKIFYQFIPLRYQNQWQVNFNDFFNDLKKIVFRNYFFAFVLTVIAWLFFYIRIYILALSIGLTVPIINLIIAVTVAGLITMLPISFLGMGTREATLIIMLQNFSNDTTKIILLSQLILLTYFASFVLGAICWKIKPLPIKLQNYEK